MASRVLHIGATVDLGWVNKDEEWVLQEPIEVAWLSPPTSWHFTVPAGFRTDLSSIPRIVRSIIPQVGRQNRASIIHDWAYEDGVPGMSRAEADQMFLDIMKLDKVNWLRRNSMYAAVRMGGGPLWGKGD